MLPCLDWDLPNYHDAAPGLEQMRSPFGRRSPELDRVQAVPDQFFLATAHLSNTLLRVALHHQGQPNWVMLPTYLQQGRQTIAPALFGLPLLCFTADGRLAGLNEAAEHLFNYTHSGPADEYFDVHEQRTASDFLSDRGEGALHELAQRTAQLTWGQHLKIGIYRSSPDGRRVQEYAEGRVEVTAAHPAQDEAAFSVLLLRPWPLSNDPVSIHVKDLTPPISRASSNPVSRALDPIPRSRTAGRPVDLPRDHEPTFKFESIIENLTSPDGVVPKNTLADKFRNMTDSALKELFDGVPVMIFVATPDGKVRSGSATCFASSGNQKSGSIDCGTIWLTSCSLNRWPFSTRSGIDTRV